MVLSPLVVTPQLITWQPWVATILDSWCSSRLSLLGCGMLPGRTRTVLDITTGLLNTLSFVCCNADLALMMLVMVLVMLRCIDDLIVLLSPTSWVDILRLLRHVFSRFGQEAVTCPFRRLVSA